MTARILSGLFIACTLTACVPDRECFLLRTDGADLPICLEGNRDSPEVLLHLAGGPSSVGGWLYTRYGLRQELKKTFLVASFDYRSMGASKGQFGVDRVTHEQFGVDVNHVVRALRAHVGDDHSVWLHGHSFGGAVGTAALLADDSEADGWISEAGCHDAPSNNALSKERILGFDPERLVDDEARTRWEELRLEIADLQPDSLSGYYGINGAANEVDGMLDLPEGPDNAEQGLVEFAFGMPFQLLQTGFPGGGANRRLSRDALQIDLLAGLADVEVPALYLVGDLDVICTQEHSQDAIDRIGSERAQLHVFEDAGHNFGDQYPEDVAAVIEAFVRP